jgi:hypothetical protein
MTASIADYYANKGDWNNVKLYVDQMLDPMARANVSNSYAWKLSGERIDTEGSNYDIASELSANSIKLLSPENPKPAIPDKK